MPSSHPRLSRVTTVAVTLTGMVIAGTAGFLAGRYPRLTPMLPVHFVRGGLPDRWVPKAWPVVLLPVFVQLGLAAVFGVILVLVVRKAAAGGAGGDDGLGQQDARRGADDLRMRAMGEAIALLAFIWIGFQALAAVRIVRLWERGGGALGTIYAVALLTAIVCSVIVAVRAMAAIRLAPIHVAGEGPHWRLRHLYVNPADPALFVPARGGIGYTLNFGRRAAVVLLAVILLIGIGLPIVIIRLLTR
jgi:uncharacterized membrane protein